MPISFIETHAKTAQDTLTNAGWFNRARLSRQITVVGISMFTTGGSGKAAARIYDGALSLVGTGPQVTVSGSNVFFYLPLSTPVVLLPNTDYYFGYYIPSSQPAVGYNGSVAAGHTHTQSGLTYTFQASRVPSGDNPPNGSDHTAIEYTMRIHFLAAGGSRRGLNAFEIGRGRRGIGP